MLNKVNPPTFIAEASHFSGVTEFHSYVEIQGTIDGEVYQLSDEPIILAKTGILNGSLHSNGPVVIRGTLKGNLASTHSITLCNTAKVHGNIESPRIGLEAGAEVNADIQVSQSAKKALTKLILQAA